MTKSLSAAEIKVSRELEKKLTPANDGDWYNTGEDDLGDDDNNWGNTYDG